MKNLWKSILIGFAVVLTECIFVTLFGEVFDGLSQAEGFLIGSGCFLAFEIVICTGIILDKIDRNK